MRKKEELRMTLYDFDPCSGKSGVAIRSHVWSPASQVVQVVKAPPANAGDVRRHGSV